MGLLVQLAGSLCILVPFVLVQRGRMTVTDRSYVVLNLVGSATLAADAAYGRQWGFLLLEAVWAAVSARSLLGPFRARPAPAPPRRGHRPTS